MYKAGRERPSPTTVIMDISVRASHAKAERQNDRFSFFLFLKLRIVAIKLNAKIIPMLNTPNLKTRMVINANSAPSSNSLQW